MDMHFEYYGFTFRFASLLLTFTLYLRHSTALRATMLQSRLAGSSTGAQNAQNS
jgi:hypothetical protein